MSQYNFKKITTIPTADEFVNIMLSRTQRKTPTVIRRHYVITRIRRFYMVKVRYITQQFCERFMLILQEFPKIDDLHPFYAELLNILYGKEHYKVALGQINTAQHLINKVGADYVKLLKYGDSLYRCKLLKRAAMGRMVTIVRNLKDQFIFMENVRQHLSRLPTIDPNDRTLLLGGCPNTGKSSFMNLLTNAKVEVQPYAFTTKSLFVGHMDFNYLRWQVIDTPGVLDRPFDEMNTIELQAVTAFTHIKSAIMFFVDLSETCDITIENQLKVFDCINPLFTDKPKFIVCTKSDLMTLDMLAVEAPEKRAAIQRLEDQGIPVFQISNMNKEGCMDLRNAACEKLLSQRIDIKLHAKKAEGVMNRVYVAMPRSDGKARPAFIPAKIAASQAQNKYITKLTDIDPDVRLESQIEDEDGDDYFVDYCKNKDLENDEWKYDKYPRFFNGKNIADFVDADFEKKLKTILAEEGDREDAGFYDVAKDSDTAQDKDFRRLSKIIKDRIIINTINKRLDSGTGIQPISRASRATTRDRTTGGLRSKFESLGVDMSDTRDAAFTRTEKRTRSESRDPGAALASKKPCLALSRSRSASRLPRGEGGETNPEKRDKLKLLMKKAIKKKQNQGARHESDRHVYDLKPKHLFTGKRGIGSTDRR